MADIKTLSPRAYHALARMAELGHDLPSHWDEGRWCMDAAIDLAALADRLNFPTVEDAHLLLSIGAILMRTVSQQLEAEDHADRLMGRIQRGAWDNG